MMAERFTANPFEVQVAHHVDEVGQPAWDALSDGQPFSSYRWYRFAEAVLGEALPVYIVLRQDGQPVARSTFWLQWEEPLPVPAGLTHRALKGLIRRWPLLICRSPLSSLPGLVLPPPPMQAEALRQMAEVALKLGRQHGASFIFYDYLEPGQLTLTGWPPQYTQFGVPDPGTALHIRWPDFETYLGAQRKSMQKDYRRHRNRAADLGLELRVAPAITTPP
ncbi:MAG: hypothetical protein JW910_20755, partial [Anaerolineae bacterium]|nr:hypothetical protein [Anaerolineae bacterium]